MKPKRLERMSIYAVIKKEFSFLESNYGFRIYMEQKRGSYHYITYTNEKKKIMVLYDDTVDENVESPVWIRIYDADCFGTAYDDVTEFRNEFFISNAKPEERILLAARWLKQNIEDKTIPIESL